MLKRILTAIPLILLVFLTIFHTSPRLFAAISALIFLYAAFEWGRLVGFKWEQQTCYVLLTLAAFLGAGLINALYIIGISTLWWLLALPLLIYFNRRQGQTSFAQYPYFWAAIGILTLVATWLGLNVLRLSTSGRFLVLFNLLIVWAADSGAYFVGKFSGKHLLAPFISPKKTLEGLAGGLITTVGVAIGGAAYFLGLTPMIALKFMLFGLITGGACAVGDLFESLLKRVYNLKDSGAILPGHGGLLDRIDGLLATTPFFTLGMLWLALL